MLLDFSFSEIVNDVRILFIVKCYIHQPTCNELEEFIDHVRVFASLPPVGSGLCGHSILLRLSGSSSSPPHESSTKSSGQSCPGIGGVYLQKKILQITRSTAKRTDRTEKATEENRDRPSCENTARKRMTSPFRRFRERTLSRERLVNSKKEDTDHNQAAESCEKVKDVGSNIRAEKGSDAFRSNSRGDRNALNYCCTRFKSKRRKTL